MQLLFGVFRFVSTCLTYVYRFAELPGIRILNLSRLLDIWMTLMCSCARLFTGAWVAEGVKNGTAKRPALPLKLYEFEACPFCKKVREVASWLDIDLEVFPTPRVTLKQYGVVEGSRYRGEVLKAGKAIFPYMEDPNTGTKMFDSSAIVDYMYATYGQGCAKPFMYASVPPGLNMLSLFLSGVPRCLPQHGVLLVPSKLPEQPLEFWGYEASSYCKIVRELLCSLELPYICHNTARGSPKREAFLAEHGKLQFPFLLDRNTGARMFESDKIVAYLRETYQTGEPVQESMSDYSTKGASADHGTMNNINPDAKKQK